MEFVKIENKETFDKYSPNFFAWQLILDFPFIYFPNKHWEIDTSDIQYYDNSVYMVSLTIYKIIKYKGKCIFHLEETKYRWGNIWYNIKFYILLPLPRELINSIQSYLGNHPSFILHL